MADKLRAQNRQSHKWENVRFNWYKFSRNHLSVVGLIMVGIVLVVAIFAGYVSPHPKSAGRYVNFYEANLPPSLDHPCGTDPFGRDVLTRIFYGYRVSLLMGVTVLSIVVPLGVILGLIAGYFRETVLDLVIMRLTDIFLAVPALLLALAICAILTPNLRNAMIAICAMWWPWYARMVYGVTSSIKGEFFVHAAELTGASRLHILFREILPNCIAPILTKASIDMAFVIRLAATLSFVGLGAQAPTPDLGTMVSQGSKYLPQQWWIAIFPALAIMFVVLGFNFFGDGIDDMLGAEGG